MKFDFVFDVPTELIGIAIVFPIVFSINAAYARREKALNHYSVLKGCAYAICLAHMHWTRVSRKTYKTIRWSLVTFLKKNLSKYLKSKKPKTDTYNYIIRLFKDISVSHEKLRKVGVSPPELSKINDYLRNMIVEFENIINIKNYRTPNSLRAYTKVFLNFFPIIFGPFFAHIAIKYNLIFGLILAVLYGIVLTSLDNIQEDLEDPFDGIGTDDISLDFPAMLEPSVTNDN